MVFVMIDQTGCHHSRGHFSGFEQSSHGTASEAPQRVCLGPTVAGIWWSQKLVHCWTIALSTEGVPDRSARRGWWQQYTQVRKACFWTMYVCLLWRWASVSLAFQFTFSRNQVYVWSKSLLLRTMLIWNSEMPFTPVTKDVGSSLSLQSFWVHTTNISVNWGFWLSSGSTDKLWPWGISLSPSKGLVQ
jgi:hypothetical protein